MTLNIELLNCFEEANQKRLSLNQFNEIEQVLAKGKFALVEHVPYYCKSTDAFAGTYQVLRGEFDSREQAEVFCWELAGWAHNEEREFEILPKLVTVVQKQVPMTSEDDIPF